MAASERTNGGRSAGRVALWVVLVLTLVAGLMFLAVAVTSSGDEQTGGLMVALPSLAIAGLCGLGLRRRT